MLQVRAKYKLQDDFRLQYIFIMYMDVLVSTCMLFWAFLDSLNLKFLNGSVTKHNYETFKRKSV